MLFKIISIISLKDVTGGENCECNLLFPFSGQSRYLALALPLQIYNTHVHNGAKIGECLHHGHKRALIVAVDIELQQRVWSDQISKSSEEEKIHVCHIQLRTDQVFTGTTIQVSQVFELKVPEQPTSAKLFNCVLLSP